MRSESQVWTCILKHLTPKWNFEAGSWIYGSGIQERRLNLKYKFGSHWHGKSGDLQ